MPSRRHVPVSIEVDAAHVQGVEAQLAGDPVQVSLGGELDLRRAEAPERAVGRRIGGHHEGLAPHILAAIGADRMNDPAAVYDRRQRIVGPAVKEHVAVEGEQPTGANLDGGSIPQTAGVPLRRGPKILVATVNQLDGFPGFEREERGVNGHQRGVLLLAAEAAARDRLHHVEPLMPQHPRERLDDIEGALHRAEEGQARRALCVDSVGGDHALRLDVELLLKAHAVGALDDANVGVSFCRGEGTIGIAVYERDVRVDVVRSKEARLVAA